MSGSPGPQVPRSPGARVPSPESSDPLNIASHKLCTLCTALFPVLLPSLPHNCGEKINRAVRINLGGGLGVGFANVQSVPDLQYTTGISKQVY